MKDRVLRHDAVSIILVSAGCTLLLLGNTLPWPCVSGSSALDCTALVTINLGELAVGLVLAAALFLLPLVTMGLRNPWNLLPWFSFWLLLYLLLGAKLYPFLDTRLPLVHVNRSLGGPVRYVVPASFLAFWLAIRPAPLRRPWRPVVLIVLVVLVGATLVFFLLSALVTYPVAFLDSPWAATVHIGGGPLLILLGSGLLLWEEFDGLRRDRGITEPESVPDPVAAGEAPARVYTIGFWSAVLLCVSLLLGVTALSVLFELIMEGRVVDTPREMALLDASQAAGPVVAFLITVPFVVLVACIHRRTHAEKKIWTQMALLLVIVYAVLYLSNVVLLPILFRSDFPLSDWLLNSLPVIHPRYGQISNVCLALVCLTGLSMLPVLDRGGIETAIRWCFVIMAAALFAGHFQHLYTREEAARPLGYSVSWLILFPLSAALFAVMFRRALQPAMRREKTIQESQ